MTTEEPPEPVNTVWGADGSEWRRCITPDGHGWTDGDHIYVWAGLVHDHGPMIRPDLFGGVRVIGDRHPRLGPS
jgi:hypothetical protein